MYCEARVPRLGRLTDAVTALEVSMTDYLIPRTKAVSSAVLFGEHRAGAGRNAKEGLCHVHWLVLGGTMLTACSDPRALNSVSCEMVRRGRDFLESLSATGPQLSLDTALDPQNESPQGPYFIRRGRTNSSEPFRVEPSGEPRAYRERIAGEDQGLVQQYIWLAWSIQDGVMSGSTRLSRGGGFGCGAVLACRAR